MAKGSRLTIPAPSGSGKIALNGAAAHKGKPGDLLVIMSFVSLDPRSGSLGTSTNFVGSKNLSNELIPHTPPLTE